MNFLHQLQSPGPPHYYSHLKRSQPEEPATFVFNKATAPKLPSISSTDLVLQVFTHPSLRTQLGRYTPDQYTDNAKLSKLGKVVLDTVMTEILFNTRPMLRATQITGKKNELLSDYLFEEWVNHYELLRKLRCDVSLRKSFSIERPQEIRDIFYAYVGGVYIDSGTEVVRQWIEQLLGQNLNSAGQSSNEASDMVVDDRTPPAQETETPPLKRIKGESMSPGPAGIFFGAQPTVSPPPVRPQAAPLGQPAMQTLYGMGQHRPNPLAPARPNLPFLPLFNQTAAQRRVTVSYDAQFSGPSHAGTWIVRCIVNGIPKGEGTGSSKQNAKEEAARQAYYAMGWT